MSRAPTETNRQHEGELSFEWPSSWETHSYRVFSAPRDPANSKSAAPNVVVRREPLEGGVKLHAYAVREMSLLAKKLPRFKLLESGETQISEVPALAYR